MEMNDSYSIKAEFAVDPWPNFRGNHMKTGLSPYDTSHLDGTKMLNFTKEGSV